MVTAAVDGPHPPARDRPFRRYPTVIGEALDSVLEASIVGSFSRAGYLLRRRVGHFAPLARLEGRVVLVTGASSGIGRAAALALGALGAEVLVNGRDTARAESVVAEIRGAGGGAQVARFDVADPVQVDAFADLLGSRRDRLDGLLHCAGGLARQYQSAPDGVELTVATHVLGPFRLTLRLAPLLINAARATIVTVSSGGMYTERFDPARLETSREHYDGVRAYARAKRAQVVLAHEWARRLAPFGVASYAMHPGWVDTPGLARGLPGFARLGFLLRRPEEGADTAVWLLAERPRPGDRTGAPGASEVLDGFFHDRRHRSEHYLPRTRPRGGAVDEGRRLWRWCLERSAPGAGTGAAVPEWA